MSDRVCEMPLAALRGEFNYEALAGRCGTQNEFNRLIIDLENLLAPAEIARIAHLHLASPVRERTTVWMKRLQAWQPDAFVAPQNYQRRPISPRAMLYRGSKTGLGKKSLMVAFCGNARRLMVPTFAFLQALDSTLWDVLVISKRAADSYSEGDGDVARDFPGLVHYIEIKTRLRKYRRTATLGTSSGGFYAIWAGALLGAERAISLGGFLPRQRAQPSLDWRDAPTNEVVLAYGEGFPQDHERALAIRAEVGGSLQPIAGVYEHNVLGALMKQGRLTAILNELLWASR